MKRTPDTSIGKRREVTGGIVYPGERERESWKELVGTPLPDWSLIQTKCSIREVYCVVVWS